MKSQHIFRIFFLSSIIFILFACKKNEEQVPVTINAESATEVTETSFKVSWSINSSDINSLSIELSSKNTFEPIEKAISVVNTSQKSQVVDQMNGATTYHYRVRASLNDGSTVLSAGKSVTTSYKTESVTITTSDGINIAGKLKYLESQKNDKPGIIFMHELGVWVNNWQSADLITSLIAQGYACLIIDFRGHGQSDYYPLPTDQSQIEEFVNAVTKDLIASIAFLQSHEIVDGEQLALVGGSLGAIMAIAGNGYDEVKATVSLSASQLGIYSVFPGLKINSAFFIAGELDANQAVNFAEEAAALYEIAEEPKKLKILSGNSSHGTDLLISPGLNQEIIDWINARFNK